MGQTGRKGERKIEFVVNNYRGANEVKSPAGLCPPLPPVRSASSLRAHEGIKTRQTARFIFIVFGRRVATWVLRLRIIMLRLQAWIKRPFGSCVSCIYAAD